jgi:hypothetical protein
MCLRGQLCKLVCKASRHHTLCKLATITITLQEQTRILRERQICQTSTLNHERVTRPPEAHPRSRCRGSGRAINIQDRAFWWKKKKHHYESTRRHAHTARRKIKLQPLMPQTFSTVISFKTLTGGIRHQLSERLLCGSYSSPEKPQRLAPVSFSRVAFPTWTEAYFTRGTSPVKCGERLEVGSKAHLEELVFVCQIK